MCRTPLNDTEAVKRRWDELRKIIGDDVMSVISGVLKQYGRHNGGELVEITHGDITPWKEAYMPSHNNIISSDTIKNFYRRLKHNDRGR